MFKNLQVSFMKKLLLASIAALLLATGTAHAADADDAAAAAAAARDHLDADIDFNCDRLPKYYLGGHFSMEHTTKDIELNFKVGFSNNRERSLPGRNIVIRYNWETDNLWINGRQCKWGQGKRRP
jgi:hypothetical protein